MPLLTDAHLNELVQEPENLNKIERAMLLALTKAPMDISNSELINAYKKTQEGQ